MGAEAPDAICNAQCNKPAPSRPHAMVIPFPAQGHIGPMMHLSVKLASEGFTITFVNTQHNHAILKPMQAQLQKQGLDIRFAEIRDDRKSGSTSGQDTLVELCKSFFSLRPALEQLVERLLRVDREDRPEESDGDAVPLTCMISDLYLYFTQDVANKFRLRRMAFWTASAGTLASMMAVKQGCRAPQEAYRDSNSRLIDWIPGVPALQLRELNTFLQPFDDKDFMFEVFQQPCRRIHEATWVALNTFDALEAASVEALRAKERSDTWTVGPLLPASFFEGQVDRAYPTAALWPEEEACMGWLDAQENESVLYVSFGSIAVLTARQFAELALGLEAAGRPLLWVIRADLMYGEGAIFPEGYLDRMRGRACFVPWAPQMRVLTHRSVGGFLTHCGWNSTLESLSAGVPMLGWPYFADQMLNNRCCVDAWGVGLDFEAGPEGLIGREEVEAKVRSLMAESGHLKASAATWKKAAQQAVDSTTPGTSSCNWADLVQALSQPPLPVAAPAL